MKNNDNVKMFFYYLKVNIKSEFQYKIDAILRSLAVFLRESTNIIVVYLTLQTFGSINGWSLYELLFLYSIIFASYGIFIVFFTGLRDFSVTIVNGNFDRVILRPRGLLFQIIARDADLLAAVGHGGLGIVLFIISANKVGVVWNFITTIYYVSAFFGGVLIQGAIFLLFASLNFYFIRTESIKDLLYYNMRKFAGYPISIFNKVIQALIIYVVPFAFVNYFPAQFLLRKPDMNSYPDIYMYIAPLVGVVMFLLSYMFWRVSVKAYKSTGN